MTYADLMCQLLKLTPEQLSCDVTICYTDRFHIDMVYHPGDCLAFSRNDDVLDDGHPFIEVVA